MFSRILNLRNLNLFHEICRLFLSVLNGLSFKNQNGICRYNCFFYRKENCFLKKKTQLQIENSGFVKTCDEHVHNCSGSNGNIFAAAENDIHKATHKS